MSDHGLGAWRSEDTKVKPSVFLTLVRKNAGDASDLPTDSDSCETEEEFLRNSPELSDTSEMFGVMIKVVSLSPAVSPCVELCCAAYQEGAVTREVDQSPKTDTERGSGTDGMLNDVKVSPSVNRSVYDCFPEPTTTETWVENADEPP